MVNDGSWRHHHLESPSTVMINPFVKVPPERYQGVKEFSTLANGVSLGTVL